MIDFRSDTVTLPDEAMRTAMANAPVGDDVYRDDPSVNTLEEWAATRHGFDSALFTDSGTQANLLALMAHCERGDEYLCGQQAHNYKYEAGGAAVLGSIQPQPIDNAPDGSLPFDKLAAAIKPNDFHFARTKLLSLENTIGGKVLPLSYLAEARTFCDHHKLQLHLDGARVYNAAVALDVDITAISCHFDSMTICLSKGLGAPVGSLLLGSQSFISKARRIRKMLGGGMRQAGMLAVAGQKVLDENVDRLAQDHANAHYLASELHKLEGFSTDAYPVQTNIVYVDIADTIERTRLQMRLIEKNIRVTLSGNPARLVTHKDISRNDIDTLIRAIAASR